MKVKVRELIEITDSSSHLQAFGRKVRSVERSPITKAESKLMAAVLYVEELDHKIRFL